MDQKKFELKVQAVRNHKGQWLKNRDYWVDDVNRAKWHSKPGPAKGNITYHAKRYPNEPVPELIVITATDYEVVDQTNGP